MAIDLIKTATKALETEVFVTAVYAYLAESLKEDRKFAGDLSHIVEMEKTHIGFWQDFLNRRNGLTVRLKPGALRMAIIKLQFRLLGRGLTLRIMETSENQAVELYSQLLEEPGLSEEERRELSHVLEDELVHEKMLLNEGTRYAGFILHVKDAVLGLSDGLVEILSVTTGLAAASGRPSFVALSGLVVGIAGGLSMGISTYASSRSQRQVSEGIMRRIGLASRFAPNIYRQRVAGNLVERGYSQKISENMADESAGNPRLLADFVASEEYGLNEATLGNPVQAGLYAGTANVLGAFIPLLPYFLTDNINVALIISLVLATAALAATGFLVSILAYLPPGRKIGEMFLSGLGSAAVTYVIGRVAAYFFNIAP